MIKYNKKVNNIQVLENVPLILILKNRIEEHEHLLNRVTSLIKKILL